MSSAEARLSNAKEWIYEHRGPILASIAVVAAILILIALTLSWFLTNSELSTVAKVDAPAELKIMGPTKRQLSSSTLPTMPIPTTLKLPMARWFAAVRSA